MTLTGTPEQRAAAVKMVLAVADAIRDLKEVPAGHLYAGLMGHMSLETFESILGILVSAGVVRRSGSHLLTWIGGAPVGRG